MALTSRITLTGPPAEDPEDFFGSSLGVIFPDDVTNQRECLWTCDEVLRGGWLCACWAGEVEWRGPVSCFVRY